MCVSAALIDRLHSTLEMIVIVTMGKMILDLVIVNPAIALIKWAQRRN